MGKNNWITKIKKQDWAGHFIELVIVILGIFIAFKLAQIGQDKHEILQYKGLIASVKLENEKNLEEFEELRIYRKEILANSNTLLDHLNFEKKPLEDSIQYYLFKLNRISTPDLQLQALERLINSTFSAASPELKTEAIRLKALYDEWLMGSEEFVDEKTEKFFNYLFDAVDFYQSKVVDMDPIYTLRFKNNIWDICGSEWEQTKLYNGALEQFEIFHKMVLTELED